MDDYAWEGCTSEKKSDDYAWEWGHPHAPLPRIINTFVVKCAPLPHRIAAPNASWRLLAAQPRARARGAPTRARMGAVKAECARTRMGPFYNFSLQFQIEIEIEPGPPNPHGSTVLVEFCLVCCVWGLGGFPRSISISF